MVSCNFGENVWGFVAAKARFVPRAGQLKEGLPPGLFSAHPAPQTEIWVHPKSAASTEEHGGQDDQHPSKTNINVKLPLNPSGNKFFLEIV